MTRLEWNLPGEQFYESGIDRGVLFVNGSTGVPWNGLTSIDDKVDGGDVSSYYLDGVRYLNIMSGTDFAATVNAFSAPPEFDECIGMKSIAKGFYASNQRAVHFDMAYRTLVGSGSDPDAGYKLHLIYNALAKKNDTSVTTHTSTVEPTNFSFDISTIPVRIGRNRPTAHFVIDSRTANSLSLGYLESIIYGTTDEPSRMPTIDEVVTLFGWITPELDFPVNIIGEISDTNRLFKNLVTNPLFEPIREPIELRRNLIPSPIFSQFPDGLLFRNTYTSDGDRTSDGRKVLLEQDIVANSFYLSFLGAIANPTVGKKLSMWVRIRNDGTTPFGVRAAVYVSGVNSYLTGEAVTIQPGATETVVLDGGIVPSGATSATPRITSGPLGQSAGAVFTILNNAVFEWADSSGPGFSGAYSPSPSRTPSWLGAANRSFSILSGVPSVEIRRNQGAAISAGSASDLFAPFTATTRAVVPDPLGGGASVIRVTTTGTSGGLTQNVVTGRIGAAENMPVGPGTFTALVMGSPGQELRVGVQEYSPTIVHRGEVWTTFIATGEWQTIILNKDVTTADSRTRIAVQSVLAGVFYIWAMSSEIGITSGGIILPGYPSPNQDLTAEWAGEPNLSKAILTGLPVIGVSTSFATAIWSSKFGGSMCLIPNTVNQNNTYAEVRPYPGLLAQQTLLGTVHLESPVTGSLYQRNLALYSASPLLGTPSAPNVSGSYVHRSVRYPTSQGRIIFYHGGAIDSGYVYWTDPAVVAGDYSGPAFAGGKTVLYKNLMLTATWDGAENDSYSTISFPEELETIHGLPGDTYISGDQLWTYHPDGYWFQSALVPF